MLALVLITALGAASLPADVTPGMPAAEGQRLLAAQPIPDQSGEAIIMSGTGAFDGLSLSVCKGVVIQVSGITGAGMADFSRQADQLTQRLGPATAGSTASTQFAAGTTTAEWTVSGVGYYLGVNDDAAGQVFYSAALVHPPAGCEED